MGRKKSDPGKEVATGNDKSHGDVKN